MRILVATIGLIFAATACESSANNVVRDDVTLIRQTHDGELYPAGMGIGTLVVRGGCVALQPDTGPAAFVMWSASADLRPSGVVVFIGVRARKQAAVDRAERGGSTGWSS